MRPKEANVTVVEQSTDRSWRFEEDRWLVGVVVEQSSVGGRSGGLMSECEYNREKSGNSIPHDQSKRSLETHGSSQDSLLAKKGVVVNEKQSA